MEVLSSINWSLVKFDVMCIETDPPNRPAGYADKMSAFLLEKGYENLYGQIGRNICKLPSRYIIFANVFIMLRTGVSRRIFCITSPMFVLSVQLRRVK